LHVIHAMLAPGQIDPTLCHRNEKVRGSSPLSSTSSNTALTRAFVLLIGQQDYSCISRVPPVLQ
jgi:hypothetical protein